MWIYGEYKDDATHGGHELPSQEDMNDAGATNALLQTAFTGIIASLGCIEDVPEPSDDQQN